MRVHSDFAAAFTPGSIFRTQSGRPITATVLEVGELPLMAGCIAFGDASDPLAMKTFARRVAAGRYLVELSLADAEPAAARVRFSKLQAVRWDAAISDGEDLDELRPVEYFGAYVGNRALAAFVDAQQTSTALPGGESIAVFSTPGPGTYAAYWGLTEHHDVAELVVDLNGFLENDYVELVLDVHGSTPRRVPIPELTRPVGDVRIIERKDFLIIDVAKKRSSELGLRGYKKKSSSSESMFVRYEFAPDVASIKAIASFGLKRMARA